MSDRYFDVKKNASGCEDPTAYEAIKKIERENREYERYRKFIGCILRICELSGYRLEERLVVKDLRTGKTWR